MYRKSVFNWVGPVFLLAAQAGCSWLPTLSSAKIAVEDEESLTISPADTRTLEIRTHNGRVSVTGRTDEPVEITVRAKKTARAGTLEAAQACLAAVEIVSAKTGSTRRLTWQWKPARQPGCDASVSFDVQMPRSLAADVATHNGGVSVSALDGACRVRTHNGGIIASQLAAGCDAESYNGSVRLDDIVGDVRARTHNGPVRITAASDTLNAESHNGSIKVELRGPHNVAGALSSHNGAVTVVMDKQAAANFDCRTHNGRITTGLDLVDVKRSRRSVTGRYGNASGALHIRTHNGAITLK